MSGPLPPRTGRSARFCRRQTTVRCARPNRALLKPKFRLRPSTSWFLRTAFRACRLCHHRRPLKAVRSIRYGRRRASARLWSIPTATRRRWPKKASSASGGSFSSGVTALPNLARGKRWLTSISLKTRAKPSASRSTIRTGRFTPIRSSRRALPANWRSPGSTGRAPDATCWATSWRPNRLMDGASSAKMRLSWCSFPFCALPV